MNYDAIEKIYELDQTASLVTQDQRVAQKKLAELTQQYTTSEALIAKARSEMAFYEAEFRRLCRRLDDIDEKRTERTSRLMSARTDDDVRAFKRELDMIERDARETQMKANDTEERLENSKSTLRDAEKERQNTMDASEAERQKAQDAEEKSSGRLGEIETVRQSYLALLDDRTREHYLRLVPLTRQSPICRVQQKSCGNCHMGLSPQILNRVILKKNVEFCPNCSHILLPAAKNPHMTSSSEGTPV